MVWKQIEATPPHLTYLILSLFLITYALFANFIRNRLHLSEPPLALASGILLGPRGLGWLTPSLRDVNGPMGHSDPTWIGGWGWGDDLGKLHLSLVTMVIILTHYRVVSWTLQSVSNCPSTMQAGIGSP